MNTISRILKPMLAAGLALLAAGCFVGDENSWAGRQQVVDAAARCGIPAFKPTKAGAAWAAYVDKRLPDYAAKEDCIYADLQRQGLLATR